MKALGKGSLASFLTVLLDVGWYGVAFVLAVTVAIGVFGPDIAVQIGPTALHPSQVLVHG